MKCNIVRETELVPGTTDSWQIGRAFCNTHGVYMDQLMADIEGAMCPIGYVSEVERRFKFEADEMRQSLKAFGSVVEGLRERLEAAEEKLGIPNPDLEIGQN